MDKNAFNKIINHPIPPELQWMLFERIRIATAVLPAVYTRWCDTPDVIKMDDGSAIRRYSFAKIALDIADELLVEAVGRAINEYERNESD